MSGGIQRVELRQVLPHTDETALVRLDTLEQRLSLHDLISGTCGIKNAREAFSNLARVHSSEMNALDIEPRAFSGRSQQLTPTIPLENLGPFMRIMLMGARIPLQRKMYLLGQGPPPMKVYAEAEICHRLAVVCAGLQPELQHSVLGFRVDLYLHLPRIAVECDEAAHKGYGLEAELRRERAIQQARDCVFVRFDPYDQSFDVFALLARIIQTADLRCPRSPCPRAGAQCPVAEESPPFK